MKTKTLGQYKTKFTRDGERVFTNALEESRRQLQFYLSIDHLLLALLRVEDEPLKLFFQQFAINSLAVEGAAGERIKHLRSYSSTGYKISPEVTDLFWRARWRAWKEKRREIGAQDILFVIAKERTNSILGSILLTMGINDFLQRANENLVKIAMAKSRERDTSIIGWLFPSIIETGEINPRLRAYLIETAISVA